MTPLIPLMGRLIAINSEVFEEIFLQEEEVDFLLRVDRNNFEGNLKGINPEEVLIIELPEEFPFDVLVRFLESRADRDRIVVILGEQRVWIPFSLSRKEIYN